MITICQQTWIEVMMPQPQNKQFISQLNISLIKIMWYIFYSCAIYICHITSGVLEVIRRARKINKNGFDPFNYELNKMHKEARKVMQVLPTRPTNCKLDILEVIWQLASSSAVLAVLKYMSTWTHPKRGYTCGCGSPINLVASIIHSSQYEFKFVWIGLKYV